MPIYREVLTMLSFEIERAEQYYCLLRDGSRWPRTTIAARRVDRLPEPDGTGHPAPRPQTP